LSPIVEWKELRKNLKLQYSIHTNLAPIAKKKNFKKGNKNLLWFFYKEVTYIHIHYIIYTFSVVGSVPTPLNGLPYLPDGTTEDFSE
jgi:hypothetical protein